MAIYRVSQLVRLQSGLTTTITGRGTDAASATQNLLARAHLTSAKLVGGVIGGMNLARPSILDPLPVVVFQLSSANCSAASLSFKAGNDVRSIVLRNMDNTLLKSNGKVDLGAARLVSIANTYEDSHGGTGYVMYKGHVIRPKKGKGLNRYTRGRRR